MQVSMQKYHITHPFYFIRHAYFAFNDFWCIKYAFKMIIHPYSSIVLVTYYNEFLNRILGNLSILPAAELRSALRLVL